MTADRVYIFDTTLRDGEQSPGASMNVEEKLRIAQQLERLNVDIIEAGFPIASKGDFEAVRLVAEKVRGCSIAGLARAKDADIDRAWEALKVAEDPRIHTFIATSPIHMQHKLRMEPEQVVEAAVAAVKRAAGYTSNVEWSAEDAGRTEIDFLCRIVEAVIKAGATTINIPDTVGYTLPFEFGERISALVERVPNMHKAIISVHCHNDLGLAVANSLSAVTNGARQVECTINGMGERAGNAALEEVVMAIQTRRDIMPFKTNVDATEITRASKLVSTITGFPVQPNKAIVGANAFAHESGIHQDGVLKKATTYEIMTPESVGLTTNRMVLGKHSGRHAFRDRLNQLGYRLDDDQLARVFIRFKALCDQKKELFDEDLEALVDDEVIRLRDYYHVKRLHVSYSPDKNPVATVEVASPDDESLRQGTHWGASGMVDSALKAVKAAIPEMSDSKLVFYQVHSITGGTDAQAEVTVRVELEEKTVNGQGADCDVVMASVKAFINALNKLAYKRDKGRNKPRSGV
ncbi:MAG: 2-isopropylmalate synthase [Magnetococcales bacterium]|nr:2-isopropylmalate synthase [Magnetococcales bacterium]